MVFNSWVFLVFFVLFYLLYLRLKHTGQNRLILIASYIFYGYWDFRFLSLIIISTLVDFDLAKRIDRTDSLSKKKWYVFISAAVNLGILGIFKYYNFFLDNLVNILDSFGYTPPPMSTLSIVLPVGISFYTFQTMSYTIDVYREKVEPCLDLTDFAIFVAFFPQLVAGPIERAGNLLHQIQNSRTIDHQYLSAGLKLIIQGYFFKVMIADNVAKIVDKIFNNPQDSGAIVLLGIYAFALQIYCDFAGYSRIARGLSRLMGIKLSVNFRQPYFSVNPSDFWRRWHISLSSWLRNYLYISLGGNRKGKVRTYYNLMLTMLLGGLWHGAAWKYIFRGFYQGLLLVVFRIFGNKKNLKSKYINPYPSCIESISVFPANLLWLVNI